MGTGKGGTSSKRSMGKGLRKAGLNLAQRDGSARSESRDRAETGASPPPATSRGLDLWAPRESRDELSEYSRRDIRELWSLFG